MPLSLTTLSLVDRPVTLEEGVRILERDQYRCRYCGLDGRASFDNALAMSVDFVVPRARSRACNKIKGRAVYKSFDDAKAFVLKRREELRATWESKTSRAAKA
jgi:5-methylcytosine-specific restriction endonuclease McrA